MGGKWQEAEDLAGGQARAATEREVDERGWFLQIEGTVSESVMWGQEFFVRARPATRPSRARGKGRLGR